MASLKEWFLKTASSYGMKRAITFYRGSKKETEISYRQMDQDSNKMAHIFLDMGIKKGDRVILFFPKSLIFMVAHIALQKIGAISVPLNPGFKKSEMSYFIQDADAKLILSGLEQEAMIREIGRDLDIVLINTEIPYQDLDLFKDAPEKSIPVKVGSGDPALIIYTSGTTGKPKGAILTQENLVHDARNIIHIWEISESDLICHALPLFHVHGLCFALHTALIAGSGVSMLDQFSARWVIELLSKKGDEEACTVFMAVPSMYSKMLEYLEDRDLNFEHIRLWTSGSAPLLPKDFRRIRKVFGKEPVEREGMSETGMNFSNPIRGVRKPGSIGLPLPDLEVRIVDPETLVDVEPGRVGEIWIKGPSVTSGYWRKPNETEKTFVNGWFRTGDLGRTDSDGYYYLTDRIKHIIISGGENISPKEVETVINQLPGVVESSVVGIPDEKWGEKVVAAVVRNAGSGLDPKEIGAYCKEHLHDWKCPKEILFVKKIPKNTMGKVLKDEVARLFNS